MPVGAATVRVEVVERLHGVVALAGDLAARLRVEAEVAVEVGVAVLARRPVGRRAVRVVRRRRVGRLEDERVEVCRDGRGEVVLERRDLTRSRHDRAWGAMQEDEVSRTVLLPPQWT